MRPMSLLHHLWVVSKQWRSCLPGIYRQYELVLLEALHAFASKGDYMKVLIRFDRAEIRTVNGLCDLQSKFHQWLKNLVRNLRNLNSKFNFFLLFHLYFFNKS